MLKRPLTVRWAVGSIIHGGLFLVPASALRLDSIPNAVVCGMVHIKDPLLLIKKNSYELAEAGFLSVM